MKSVHSLMMQLMGHAKMLQSSVSVRLGQDPPWLDDVTTDRDCVRTPPPHEAVHSEKSVHSETTQLIGHEKLLHVCEDVNAAHPPPYMAVVTTERERDWAPPPHECEHAV